MGEASEAPHLSVLYFRQCLCLCNIFCLYNAVFSILQSSTLHVLYSTVHTYAQICFIYQSKWTNIEFHVCMHATGSCAHMHAWNGLKSCVHYFLYIKILFYFHDHSQIWFLYYPKSTCKDCHVCMHATGSCAHMHARNGLKSCVHSYLCIKIIFYFHDNSQICIHLWLSGWGPLSSPPWDNVNQLCRGR